MEKEQYLDKVAELLQTSNALSTLSQKDARAVVSYMLLTHYPQGFVIFNAQDPKDKSDYLLLVISGEVAVETQSSGDGAVVVDVLTSGHLIGEMGVIEGKLRSATCTAQSKVDVGMLSKFDLERLLEEQPALAARFILAIAQRLGERIRTGNHKLLMMTQVNMALEQELAELQVKGQRGKSKVLKKWF